jgi:HD-like signal output (HDOD) protein
MTTAQLSIVHPNATDVRSLLLQDDQGELWVLAPSGRILDLLEIHRTQGRTLRPVLPQPDAFQAGKRALLVDEGLLDADAVQLLTDTGLQSLASDQFGALIQGATLQRISQPLGPNPADLPASEDLARIKLSLDKFTDLRLRRRLDETLHIPPLPEAARRILELRSDPFYETRDLVKIIEADPSLASRILGWANSAYYGLREPVTNLHDAVMRVLGPNTVLRLALAVTMHQQLRVPAAEVRGLSPYWLEAMYSAATMEILAAQMPASEQVDSGLAYMTGLLSNFGTLVIGHVFPPIYANICLLQEANLHLPHSYIDQHCLGTSREMFASELLRNWALPDQISTAVRYQLIEDYQGEHGRYVLLLQLARQMLINDGITGPARIGDRQHAKPVNPACRKARTAA